MREARTGVAGFGAQPRASGSSGLHPYSNATQTRWDKGEFKVQLLLPDNSRPMGFCDGTAADLAELQAIAEAENSQLRVEKKVLKTGREVWTLHGGGS